MRREPGSSPPSGVFMVRLQPTARRRSAEFGVAPVKTKPEPGSHRLQGRGWSRHGSASPVPVPCTAAAPGNNLFPVPGSSHASAGCQRRLPFQRPTRSFAAPSKAEGRGSSCRSPQPPSRPLFPPRPPPRQLLGAAAAARSLAGPVNVSIDVTGAFPAFLPPLQETGARSRDSPAVAGPAPPPTPAPCRPRGSPRRLQEGSVALAPR